MMFMVALTATVTMVMTVVVGDTNDPPTGVRVFNTNGDEVTFVDENVAIGTEIGYMVAIDEVC